MDIAKKLIGDKDCSDTDTGQVYMYDVHSSYMMKSDSCTDMVTYNMDDIYCGSSGCVVVVNVSLKMICPGKKVALAVMLYEIDEMGCEISRGFKCIEVPAHQAKTCRDMEVRNICFAVPAGNDATRAAEANCRSKQFIARVVTNYVDCPIIGVTG